MPVVDHGDGAHVEYRIPQEIYERIPEYFYSALAGELFSVFGWERARLMFYSENSSDYIDLDSGTQAWTMAFKATCDKLNMGWLYEYYRTLPWYDGDVFDGIIERETGRRFMTGRNENINAYYLYLLDQNSRIEL